MGGCPGAETSLSSNLGDQTEDIKSHLDHIFTDLTGIRLKVQIDRLDFEALLSQIDCADIICLLESSKYAALHGSDGTEITPKPLRTLPWKSRQSYGDQPYGLARKRLPSAQARNPFAVTLANFRQSSTKCV